MIDLTTDILLAIAAHGIAALPNESCGVLIERDSETVFMPCRNTHPTPANKFEIHAADYATAEDAGRIIAIVHTHTNGSAKPSEADKLSCEKTGLPWIIMTIPQQAIYQFEPTGYEQQLLGRAFEWGASDCFTLVRLYYRTTLGIEIDYNAPYEYGFWKKGLDLYKKLEDFGFIELPSNGTPQLHDIFIIRIPPVELPSHAAVYLGNNRIMHHVRNSLSKVDVYNDFWQNYTVRTMRHESLC